MVSSQTTPLSVKRINLIHMHVALNEIPYIGLNFMPV